MSLEQIRSTSYLYGGNASYIEDRYEQYLADPTRVAQEWRDYFDALQAMPAVDGSQVDDVPHAPIVERFAALARRSAAPAPSGEAMRHFAHKQLGVQALITAYRTVGNRQADLDPLQWTPVARLPELAPAWHGLTNSDLGSVFSGGDAAFSKEDIKLDSLVSALQETYCGTLASEYMHLADPEQRRWWQMRLESTRAKGSFWPEKKLRILDRLTAAEGLERYLGKRFVGQQRFSLEGGECLIVLLDELLHTGAALGIGHVVLGMAHRGRINVLHNVAGKPAAELFQDFEGGADAALLSGDVKYHKGYTGRAETDSGAVEVLLAFNPSHLEFINPVVQGLARAKAEGGMLSQAAVLPVEIHGDAAVIGQGIVQETLNLSYTRGHGTGGTMHIVVNNQLGFTTSEPVDARSAWYCTDIAKMIEAPVLHVNGDDPEAVVYAAQLALEYRARFARSVVVELVCYRRHGHQEQDTPTMTQPLMYRAIAEHPGVRALYVGRLRDEGLVTDARADELVQDLRDRLESAHAESTRMRVAAEASEARMMLPPPSEVTLNRHAYVAPAIELVGRLAERIVQVPEGYALHPLVRKMLAARREMAAGQRPLDWGMAEHLAFATLLSAGIDVRLSGQDSERGTFGHRHAVIHDQGRAVRGEGRFVPLQNLGEPQGAFRVTNSTLSEAAVLAYEYGYSVARPTALVLWEAQFGDFANGAQVVIDQFISAGFAKWGQRSSVVMLLPHGQEGQGPEHASARLERYLQLCAQENMLVCQPTTPAQFFHLVRAQATLPNCRPLVVMTPKSLLRHPGAVSDLADLAKGPFAPVLGDPAIGAAEGFDVERVIVCSGKVYYELLEHRDKSASRDAAIVRLEQLYPFPADLLAAELARYPHARVVVWCQEEARNQGAWCTLEHQLQAVARPVPLQYAGPAAAASTSPGYVSVHQANQRALVIAAFEA